MPTILVTGGSGYLGQLVIAHLEREGKHRRAGRPERAPLLRYRGPVPQ